MGWLQTLLQKVTPGLISPTVVLWHPLKLCQHEWTRCSPSKSPFQCHVTYGTCHTAITCSCTIKTKVSQEDDYNNVLTLWEPKMFPQSKKIFFLSQGHIFVMHINAKQRFKEWHLGFGQRWAQHASLERLNNHGRTGFNSPLHYILLSSHLLSLNFIILRFIIINNRPAYCETINEEMPADVVF